MSITDVRVQVPPRAPRSTGGLPSGGTPQRGDTGSKVHIDARVVELADSLDSGSSVHYGRAGSSPASRTIIGARFALLRCFFIRSSRCAPMRLFRSEPSPGIPDYDADPSKKSRALRADPPSRASRWGRLCFFIHSLFQGPSGALFPSCVDHFSDSQWTIRLQRTLFFLRRSHVLTSVVVSCKIPHHV